MKHEGRLQALTGVVFFVGVLGHGFASTLPLMLLLTPYLLGIFGLAAAAFAMADQGRRVAVWLAGTYLATFFLEVLGVATGQVFGAYSYGVVLGSHLFGVPPIIGFNWAVVVLGCVRAVRRFSRGGSPLAGAAAAAALCVLFDILLEPLAIRLGYWTWAESAHSFQGVPLRNYLAWFLIAFFAALPAWRLPAPGKSRFAEAYVAVQAVFFVLTRIMLALFGAP